MKKERGAGVKFIITLLFYIHNNYLKPPYNFNMLAINFKCHPRTIKRAIKLIEELNLLPQTKRLRRFQLEHHAIKKWKNKREENLKNGQDFMNEVFKKVY